MKILLAHNCYRSLGGEDTQFCANKALLNSSGHRVAEYLRHNEEIYSSGWWGKTTLAPRAIWAWDSHQQLREVLQRERPEVAHFHNTFPLISPAAYYACQEANVPVVQTLSNYRLFCSAGTFFRNGKACQECLQHSLWRGVRYGCYQGSRLTTGAVALMLALHRTRGTWMNKVDCYLVPSEFGRRKFIEARLPEEKIAVKPNVVYPDPGVRHETGDYAVFVGRLSKEKGLHTLLLAWERLGGHVPLRIIGDGPLRSELEAEAARQGLSSVRFLGHLPHCQTLAAIKQARLLILPSESYEMFGVVVVEAFTCGVPVLVSGMGGMEEIVEEGCTGLHFRPGEADDLAERVGWSWNHPQQMEEMGRAARAVFEAKYNRECNYRELMRIYEQAIRSHAQVGSQ